MDVLVPVAPTCDGLLVPLRYKAGATQPERVRSIDMIADPLLGVDRAARETNYQRVDPIGHRIFVTKSTYDSLYFRTAPPPHRLAGRRRYTWIECQGGIARGYLIPEAREDLERHLAENSGA